MEESLTFVVRDASQVGEVRRAATSLARLLGFNETDSEKVAIVATELGTNLVKHTPGGHLLIQTYERQGVSGLELLSLDQGPGIPNVAESLRDGYSTAGSGGDGLGAIRRLANQFDIYSRPGVGTALVARLWPDGRTVPGHEIGLVCLRKTGESECGDKWATVRHPDRSVLLVADGLGHGPGAALAANEAIRVFQENPNLELAALLEKMHKRLRSTRGAAVALAELRDAGQLNFVGVGNIVGAVFGGEKVQHTVSHNGIVGHTIHRIQTFTYPWQPESLFVMHSDGLGTRWNLNAYPGLLHRHPSLIAGTLWRDFKRDTDDVTVLVAKESK